MPYPKFLQYLRPVFFWVLLASCLCPAVGQGVVPQTFSGKVVAVKDGDTIEVLYDSTAVKIRLAHVDCPESGQPFGKNAKQFVSDLCYWQQVNIEQQDSPDRYGRLIALVFVGDLCVNMALVEAGYAWHFKKYSQDSSYALAEEVAKLQGLGLWSEKDAIAPWEWRRLGRGGN